MQRGAEGCSCTQHSRRMQRHQRPGTSCAPSRCTSAMPSPVTTCDYTRGAQEGVGQRETSWAAFLCDCSSRCACRIWCRSCLAIMSFSPGLASSPCSEPYRGARASGRSCGYRALRCPQVLWLQGPHAASRHCHLPAPLPSLQHPPRLRATHTHTHTHTHTQGFEGTHR